MANLVRDAWLATAQLGESATAETREAAFTLVLESLLKANDVAYSVKADTGVAQAEPPDDSNPYATPELRMDAISQYLEIEGDDVEVLFSFAETEPTLQVQPQRLSSQKQTATREIAQLVVAGRTALGLQSTTDHIRERVEFYRRYDAANFMSALQDAKELVVLGKPRSKSRVVRLRGVGVEAVKELAQKLVAE